LRIHEDIGAGSDDVRVDNLVTDAGDDRGSTHINKVGTACGLEEKTTRKRAEEGEGLDTEQHRIIRVLREV
jgi:hypothetical protein